MNAHGAAVRFAFLILGLCRSQTIKAVSYTHLDVYKRQGKTSRKINSSPVGTGEGVRRTGEGRGENEFSSAFVAPKRIERGIDADKFSAHICPGMSLNLQ